MRNGPKVIFAEFRYGEQGAVSPVAVKVPGTFTSIPRLAGRGRWSVDQVNGWEQRCPLSVQALESVVHGGCGRLGKFLGDFI